MIFVIVFFDGNGFVGWKRGMFIVLFIKNKIGFVNGCCIRFIDIFLKLRNWERYNDTVIFQIQNVFVKEIVDSVLYSFIGREIWREFEERFGQINRV